MHSIPGRYLEPAKYIWDELLKEKQPLDQIISQFFAAEKKYGKRDRRWISEPLFYRARNYLLIDELPAADQWPASYHLASLTTAPERLEREIETLKAKSVHLRYSLTPFFYDSLSKDLTKEDLDAIRKPGKVCFRINTNTTTVEEIKNALNDIELEKYQLIDNCLILDSRLSRGNPLLKSGKLIPQDMGSQQVVPFMKVSEPVDVLDMCAGAGGKAIHLSAIMQNQGTVFAYDHNRHRLNKLKPRLKQTNSRNIKLLYDLSSHILFDRVLVDAPCSGSGAIARHPEIAMRISQESLARVLADQQKILNSATKLLKPGGTITYATCSLFPTENEDQVKKFLNEHKEFALKDQTLIQPASFSGEGYFVCNLTHRPV